ncbi:MAG: hypothetical protein UIG52_06820 [Bacteroidales bacterium]|nr:hypothetical protein [Bacteroidales bacterium]
MKTYDSAKVYQSLNGIALTEVQGEITVEPLREGEFTLTFGNLGQGERSRVHNNFYRVTIPMMQTAAQLSALEALRIADNEAGAGPYPYSLVDQNGFYTERSGSYVLMGSAYIENMSGISRGQSTTPRNVVLIVEKQAGFEG